MIWSLTPFFNEIDVLEIRLAELDPVVDVHVVAEATVTQSGQSKPLNFLEHEDRFAPWRDKIRYVVVDDMPEGTSTVAPYEDLRPSGDSHWFREFHQRNALARGIEGMRDRDLVLLSDLDEIVAANVIEDMPSVPDGTVWRPALALHIYWLNWRWVNLHRTPVACFVSGATLRRWGPQRVREAHFESLLPGYMSGWHFCYLGGVEAMQAKLKAAAHREVDRPPYNDAKWLEQCLADGRDLFGRDRPIVSVDLGDLPSHVGHNLDRFRQLIGPKL